MNTTIFRTCDLPLAAFLRCKGIQLADEYNIRTKEWSFKEEEECKKLSLCLSNGEAQVDVIEYEMHRRTLLSAAKRSRND